MYSYHFWCFFFTLYSTFFLLITSPVLWKNKTENRQTKNKKRTSILADAGQRRRRARVREFSKSPKVWRRKFYRNKQEKKENLSVPKFTVYHKRRRLVIQTLSRSIDFVSLNKWCSYNDSILYSIRFLVYSQERNADRCVPWSRQRIICVSPDHRPRRIDFPSLREISDTVWKHFSKNSIRYTSHPKTKARVKIVESASGIRRLRLNFRFNRYKNTEQKKNKQTNERKKEVRARNFQVGHRSRETQNFNETARRDPLRAARNGLPWPSRDVRS